jgi:hypothetical protein
MKRALLLPVVLAACVQSEIPDSERFDGVLAGTPFEIAGTTVVAQQMSDWPVMINAVDASGRETTMQRGTAETVVISGAPDFASAVNALGQFCGRRINLAGFDTQFVYQEPSSGDYWFDGFCA